MFYIFIDYRFGRPEQPKTQLRGAAANEQVVGSQILISTSYSIIHYHVFLVRNEMKGTCKCTDGTVGKSATCTPRGGSLSNASDSSNYNMPFHAYWFRCRFDYFVLEEFHSVALNIRRRRSGCTAGPAEEQDLLDQPTVPALRQELRMYVTLYTQELLCT